MACGVGQVEGYAATRLAGASQDTLKREHSDKIVKISRRREGMRVAHALMLREVTDAA